MPAGRANDLDERSRLPVVSSRRAPSDRFELADEMCPRPKSSGMGASGWRRREEGAGEGLAAGSRSSEGRETRTWTTVGALTGAGPSTGRSEDKADSIPWPEPDGRRRVRSPSECAPRCRQRRATSQSGPSTPAHMLPRTSSEASVGWKVEVPFADFAAVVEGLFPDADLSSALYVVDFVVSAFCSFFVNQLSAILRSPRIAKSSRMGTATSPRTRTTPLEGLRRSKTLGSLRWQNA